MEEEAQENESTLLLKENGDVEKVGGVQKEWLFKAGEEMEIEGEPEKDSSQPPTKRAPKQRPAYLKEDERYGLFSSIYIDRHTVTKLVANVVKELKVWIPFKIRWFCINM